MVSSAKKIQDTTRGPFIRRYSSGRAKAIYKSFPSSAVFLEKTEQDIEGSNSLR